MADRPISFGVLAADEDAASETYQFLFPPPCRFSNSDVVRVASDDDFRRATLGFAEPGMPHPANFYAFDRSDPGGSAARLLGEHEDDWLPLARNFPGFRRSVSERLILKVAKENAGFAIATALPNVIPSLLVLPWSVGELASDSAVLTVNQIRLSFLLAAAHGREVGYDRQCLKVGSIIGAAFGWRALARQLVSKVPAGGGLVSKGLIAFAGTYTVGRGLEHWFRNGTRLGRSEQRQSYENARRSGREAVEGIVRRALRDPRSTARAA